MRIAIDALGLPLVGGAKTSAIGWITALGKYGSFHKYDVYVSQLENQLTGLDNINQRVVNINNRFAIRVWAQLFLPLQLKWGNINLLHSVKNMGILTSVCPTILTINDLTHLQLAYLYPKVDNYYWKYIQSLILGKTTRIIAISKTTKKYLMEYYKLPENKIEVIYPSCHPQFHTMAGDEIITQTLNKYNLKPQFLLYVGGLGKHKNVRSLIMAFSKVAGKIQNDLVIVGGQEHTTSDNQVNKTVCELGLSNRIIFLENIPLIDLTILYQAAKLFVFLSLNEGFGIANLEAMASGTPILTTGRGSIPEIVGDAAMYIEDPHDHDKIAQKTMEIILNENKMKVLKQRGLHRSKDFTWENTARKTLKVYDEAIIE